MAPSLLVASPYRTLESSHWAHPRAKHLTEELLNYCLSFFVTHMMIWGLASAWPYPEPKA